MTQNVRSWSQSTYLHLQTIESKRRLSYSDKQLQNLNRAYGTMLSQNFAKQNVASNLWGMSLGD